jgi:hypothetical protein
VMNTQTDQSRCTLSIHGDFPRRSALPTAESGAGANQLGSFDM